jgi:hypothetical protein
MLEERTLEHLERLNASGSATATVSSADSGEMRSGHEIGSAEEVKSKRKTPEVAFPCWQEDNSRSSWL